MYIVTTIIGTFLGGVLFCFLIGWVVDKLIISRVVDDRIKAIAISGIIGGLATMLLAVMTGPASWGIIALTSRAAGCVLGWYMRHYDAKRKLSRA